MSPTDHEHTPIFGRRIFQWNPNSDNAVANLVVEIGMVLMPGLLTAARGLDQRHILEEFRLRSEHRAHKG